jgi:TrmH family RNA methyltransferase
MVITSVSNEQMKNIIQLKEKAKYRKKQKQFVVEGIKMFSEVPKEYLNNVYVSESFLDEHKDFYDEYKEKLKTCKIQTVSDSVFKKISDTVTPQGILAIVAIKEWTIEQIIENRMICKYNKTSAEKCMKVEKNHCVKEKTDDAKKIKSCIVVLDRLQDPGNLGTIIRTGEGAGIAGIVMSSDCADIYNPKVIRSTMGSIFRVPVVVVENLPAAIMKLKSVGVTTYAAHLKGNDYNEEKFADDCALLIGNEARGLSEEVADTADKLIKIPMEGKVESLNAAIATAILMYQVKM